MPKNLGAARNREEAVRILHNRYTIAMVRSRQLGASEGSSGAVTPIRLVADTTLPYHTTAKQDCQIGKPAGHLQKSSGAAPISI